MAYNKSKYVEAAQELLNQGKVAQAIGEYQNILKYEPRDQVTLMTIGELYIRQGETFQAIDYFERLAQIFVGDGFLTKAIAVYKRIAKLAPEEIRQGAFVDRLIRHKHQASLRLDASGRVTGRFSAPSTSSEVAAK